MAEEVFHEFCEGGQVAKARVGRRFKPGIPLPNDL
jgi:hypothetical protein